jgi:hypothetical protein
MFSYSLEALGHHGSSPTHAKTAASVAHDPKRVSALPGLGFLIWATPAPASAAPRQLDLGGEMESRAWESGAPDKGRGAGGTPRLVRNIKPGVIPARSAIWSTAGLTFGGTSAARLC